jgi:hypothetical protein
MYIPEYLSTRQAAAYLNLSRQYLEIGRCRGYGPPFIRANGGRAVRYYRPTLDQWMLAHQRNLAAEEVGHE